MTPNLPLGPLQGEGVMGTLTIQMSSAPGGTELSWSYVVGGNARMSLAEVAGTVDQVLAEQMSRLVGQLANPEAPR